MCMTIYVIVYLCQQHDSRNIKNLLQRHNYACFSLRLSSMNEMQFYDDFQVCFSAVKF